MKYIYTLYPFGELMPFTLPLFLCYFFRPNIIIICTAPLLTLCSLVRNDKIFSLCTVRAIIVLSLLLLHRTRRSTTYIDIDYVGLHCTVANWLTVLFAGLWFAVSHHIELFNSFSVLINVRGTIYKPGQNTPNFTIPEKACWGTDREYRGGPA